MKKIHLISELAFTLQTIVDPDQKKLADEVLHYMFFIQLVTFVWLSKMQKWEFNILM